MKRGPPTRIKDVWPSNNRFFFGCCITGPSKNWPGSVCIYVCSLAALLSFSLFIAADNWKISAALPILYYLSAFLMHFFMYLTACSDPGIIPRRPFLERAPEKHQKYLSAANSYGRTCSTCLIVRPARASHCSTCQNCVQVLDHHCWFVGTCIGKRNYRFFILFLGHALIAVLMFLLNLVVLVVNKSGQISEAAIIAIVAVVSALLGLPLLAFFGFHIYLAVTGATTREVIKQTDRQGTQQEESSQWCGVDDCLVDFWEEISEEQARSLRVKLGVEGEQEQQADSLKSQQQLK